MARKLAERPSYPLCRMRNGSAQGTLYILGAGWFSVEVAGWAEESGWRVGGLVELMDSGRVGGSVDGYPIVDAASLPSGTAAVAAGGRSLGPRGAPAGGREARHTPPTGFPPTPPI